MVERLQIRIPPLAKDLLVIEAVNDGEFVRYSGYAALEAEVERLRQAASDADIVAKHFQSERDHLQECLEDVLEQMALSRTGAPEVEALRAEVESLRFYQATVQAGLTPLERRIACKLYEEGETGMTAADLSKMLYGFAHPVEQKTVRTLVGRIRRKMAPLGWAVSNPGGGRGRPVGSFTVERVEDARKKR